MTAPAGPATDGAENPSAVGLVRRLFRYSSASAAGLVVSQIVLVLGLSVAGWSAVTANLVSVSLGAVPNYTINRYWTWSQVGPNRVWTEIVPFWTMAFIGLGASLFTVDWAYDRYGTELAAMAAQIATFGTLWVVKFAILDRLVWRRSEA